MVSGEPACAARREVARSNLGHESVHRGHCRGLSFQSKGGAPGKPVAPLISKVMSRALATDSGRIAGVFLLDGVTIFLQI